MKDNIFISWSGELSYQLAEIMRKVLPWFLQNISPYFTPRDIDKGDRWESAISTHLENAEIGLICLTPYNLSNEWILFEAGALSKSKNNARVCVLLFNIAPSDVQGPLSNFQATKFEKEDFRKLLLDINEKQGENGRDTETLNEIFENQWPKVQKMIEGILSSSDDKDKKAKKRSQSDILEEVLENIRNLSRIVKPAEENISINPLISSNESSGTSRMAFQEIVDRIISLYYSYKYGSECLDFESLGQAIRRLGIELNRPDLYGKFLKVLREKQKENLHSEDLICD